MQFRILSLFALVATAVVAQQSSSGDNAFKIPPGGIAFTAGQPATISWTPSTQGTVTLKLREGAESALNPGTVIKCELSSSSFPVNPSNPLGKLVEWGLLHNIHTLLPLVSPPLARKRFIFFLFFL